MATKKQVAAIVKAAKANYDAAVAAGVRNPAPYGLIKLRFLRETQTVRFKLAAGEAWSPPFKSFTDDSVEIGGSPVLFNRFDIVGLDREYLNREPSCPKCDSTRERLALLAVARRLVADLHARGTALTVVTRGRSAMRSECEIAHESPRGVAWVHADVRARAYVVYVTGAVCSTSDSAYPLDADGLSLARARADYLDRRSTQS